MRKTRMALLLLIGALSFGSIAHAELVIIVHPGGPDTITKQQVRNIYLNRSSQMPDGQQAVPFELPAGNSIRDKFNEMITERSDAWMQSFWSRQVLTGKGQPPTEMSSASGMKSVVSSTLGAIGYLDSTLVDDSVKVAHYPEGDLIGGH
ncbi:phosphate ABC transporter substrate-binding protein [Marinobacter sp. CHS3-4]|uniref:phosphate ABC transporter substrate-binding protein n=1 Tax=Marinobacter sp. CHS3-4 TaxID=3045174 RepID=UPI0024B4C19F|nr:phosphate ABC transporter substrate-binding protein [Marinobacter sp. CHS3-4]MDI9244049.1 phosphate ABC transporter substrate-binding protein [Marinobacter sp. CHS3-4]